MLFGHVCCDTYTSWVKPMSRGGHMMLLNVTLDTNTNVQPGLFSVLCYEQASSQHEKTTCSKKIYTSDLPCPPPNSYYVIAGVCSTCVAVLYASQCSTSSDQG